MSGAPLGASDPMHPKPLPASSCVDFLQATPTVPYTVRLVIPGDPTPWLMDTKYARELAAALEGTALAVDHLNGPPPA